MTLEFEAEALGAIAPAPAPAPLCKWFGGKSKTLAGKIADMLPDHQIYVEPFGGMAGVLMAKRPVKVEIYNDLENGLVNLFEVVRDPERCRRLIELLELTPYSRAEHANCRQNWRAEAEPIEKARMVYTILNQCFVGLLSGNSGWNFGGPSAATSRKKYGPAEGFYQGLENIKLVAGRLKTVVIENKPAFELLKRWDTPQTLFYLDPPYLPETRQSGEYTFELDPAEHVELLDWCLAAEGMVVLSGYNSELYTSKLTGANWHRIEYNTASSGAIRSASNGLKNQPFSVFKRTECIWLNPAAWDKSPANQHRHQAGPIQQAALW